MGLRELSHVCTSIALCQAHKVPALSSLTSTYSINLASTGRYTSIKAGSQRPTRLRRPKRSVTLKGKNIASWRKITIPLFLFPVLSPDLGPTLVYPPSQLTWWLFRSNCQGHGPSFPHFPHDGRLMSSRSGQIIAFL